MQQRTFKAKNVTEALALVKRELGSDAMIISTRSVRTKAVLGLPGRAIVEITAGLPEPVRTVPERGDSFDHLGFDRATSQSRRARAAAAAGDDHAPHEDIEAAIATAVAPRQSPGHSSRYPGGFPTQALPSSPQDAIARLAPSRPVEVAPPDDQRQQASRPERPAHSQTQTPAQTERANISSLIAGIASAAKPDDDHDQAHDPRARSPRVPVTPVYPDPVSEHARRDLETELASIRALVGQVLQTTQRTAVAFSRVNDDPGIATGGIAPSDPLFASYTKLLDAQTPPEIADQIVGAIRADLSRDELADAGIIRQTLLALIARRLPTAKTPQVVGCRRIALFGPTGVGKTTTIAKLAATYRLRHGKSVALITTDTYRIAAIEQLRTYAGLIGIQLKVARDESEVRDACNDFQSHDLVLIDTAGRSHRDTTRIAELASLTDAAEPHERHLVLSTTTPTHAIGPIATRFHAANPDRLIATKLDETIGLGVLLALQSATKLPFSHVTTGQEVPDDIQAANPDKLARFVLDQFTEGGERA